MITKIRKFGGISYIKFPEAILKNLDMKIGTKLIITSKDGKLIVSSSRKEYKNKRATNFRSRRIISK